MIFDQVVKFMFVMSFKITTQCIELMSDHFFLVPLTQSTESTSEFMLFIPYYFLDT